MEKNKNHVYLRLLLGGSIGFLLFFLYCITFVIERDYQFALFTVSTDEMKHMYNLILIGGALIIVCGILFFQKSEIMTHFKISRIFSKIENYYRVQSKNRIYIYVVYSFLFLCLTYFCYQKFTGSPWGSDLVQVYQVAYHKYFGLEFPLHIQEYIERYPNNLAISWYTLLIFRFFNSVQPELVYIVNTIIELIFILLISNRIFKKNKNIFHAILPIFGLLLFTPMLSYLSFPYTDNLGVFGLFFMYLIVQNRCWEKPWFFLLLAVPIGIFLSARANIVVGVVALVVLVFYLYDSKKEIKYYRKISVKAVLSIGLVIVSLLSMKMTITTLGYYTDVDIVKKSFPATHWLNMGQEEAIMGTYNHGDAMKTHELLLTEGPEKAQDYNLKSAIKRFSERRIKANWKFFTEKVSYEWSNSDFSMIKNLVVFKGVDNEQYKQLAAEKTTQYMQFHLDIFTRIIYLLLFFQTIYFFRNPKKVTPEFIFVLLSFLGTVGFYMLWEAAERYGFVAMPILILGVIYVQTTIYNES